MSAPLAGGEVNFLWWFSQGSIMDADVRTQMRAAWGLCERHTAAWLAVESAFRHRYLHGPAVFYGDLMQRARQAFRQAHGWSGHGPTARLVARRLRPRAACHLCALGLGPDSVGYIPPERLEAGRDIAPLRAFMQHTEGYWRAQVCGSCAGSGNPARCRAHFCAEVDAGAIGGLDTQRALVDDIAHHVQRYDESFRWERRGTDTAQDRAALIAAAGWSGGWRGLLAVRAAA